MRMDDRARPRLQKGHLSSIATGPRVDSTSVSTRSSGVSHRATSKLYAVISMPVATVIVRCACVMASE